MFETEVCVSFTFSHRLEGFGEEFSKAHQHNWSVTVVLATLDVDQRGAGMDFVKLKENLVELLEPYQGKLLNDSDLPFCTQPTAEHIALWVADSLSKIYPGLIRSVSVGSDKERARFIVDT